MVFSPSNSHFNDQNQYMNNQSRSLDSLNDNEYIDNLYDRKVKCDYTLSSDIDWLDKTHMSFLHCNIRSMYSNFDRFSAEFLSSMVGPTCVGLCETRLTDVTCDLDTIQNYSFYVVFFNLLS